MARGSRQDEVTSQRSIARFTEYIQPDAESIRLLKQANRSGDEMNMREILAQSSKYDFLGDLMNIYDGLIPELTDSVLNRYGDRVDETGRQDTKQRQAPTDVQGQYVRRGQKFSKVEEAFIRNRVDMGPKRLQEEFNARFPGRQRGYKQMANKKYRVQRRRA